MFKIEKRNYLLSKRVIAAAFSLPVRVTSVLGNINLYRRRTQGWNWD